MFIFEPKTKQNKTGKPNEKKDSQKLKGALEEETEFAD